MEDIKETRIDYISNMKPVIESVKELLNSKDAESWKQGLLAKKIGIRPNTLWRWRLGKGKPHEGNLNSLADVFKKDIIWNDKHTECEFKDRELKPGEEFPPSPDRPKNAFWAPPDIEGLRVPLIGNIGAGTGAAFDDMGYPVGAAEEWLVRPYDLKDITAYALRVDSIYGESMYPVFRPGDIVWGSPAATVKNKDRVVVKLKDSEETMVKEIRFHGDKIDLISLNPDYKPHKTTLTVDQIVFYHKVVHVKPR